MADRRVLMTPRGLVESVAGGDHEGGPLDRAPMDRRTFCMALTAALAGSAGCFRRDEDVHAGLVRLFGLAEPEAVWLDDLSEPEKAELYGALVDGDASPRAVELVLKVLGRRERLFAYVGYPVLQNRLSGCDGLLRK